MALVLDLTPYEKPLPLSSLTPPKAVISPPVKAVKAVANAVTPAAGSTVLGVPTADVVIGGAGVAGLLILAKVRGWL